MPKTIGPLNLVDDWVLAQYPLLNTVYILHFSTPSQYTYPDSPPLPPPPPSVCQLPNSKAYQLTLVSLAAWRLMHSAHS